MMFFAIGFAFGINLFLIPEINGTLGVNPGDNKYQITSPVFSKIELQLDNDYYHGNKFTIIAHNNPKENIYIHSIKLNGKYLDRYWITHAENFTRRCS